jgi:hypothetical protein
MITTLLQGLEVTLYGLLGVFGALVALYFCVILLGKIPEHEKESE